MEKLSNEGVPVAITTAGLRGSHWREERLPADVKVVPKSLITEDGAQVTGFLFYRGGEKTVVCAMHPREMLVTQYLVPEILSGGCAVWVMGSRNAGNDLRLEHEKALLDLAAGQRHLLELGYEHRVLVGTSGGGPLAAYYVQQAGRPTEQRVARSPGGKPTGLQAAEMPLPDGVILVSSHLGQGTLLMKCIDPSVVDENDPMQTDERYSIFNPDNGFCPPPQSSSYRPDFLAHYRVAQRERVARIDSVARKLIEQRLEAKKRFRSTQSYSDAAMAAYSPIFTVWRTDADPRCFDLSLEPSNRAYGSLWGAHPFNSNFGSVGFGRVCTPESWLSNWSGISSNASMEKCAPSLQMPVLMVVYDGDNSVFPSEAQQLFDLIGSDDKTRRIVAGNHHGKPVRPGQPDGQAETGAHIREWLGNKNFV